MASCPLAINGITISIMARNTSAVVASSSGLTPSRTWWPTRRCATYVRSHADGTTPRVRSPEVPTVAAATEPWATAHDHSGSVANGSGVASTVSEPGVGPIATDMLARPVHSARKQRSRAASSKASFREGASGGSSGSGATAAVCADGASAGSDPSRTAGEAAAEAAAPGKVPTKRRRAAKGSAAVRTRDGDAAASAAPSAADGAPAAPSSSAPEASSETHASAPPTTATAGEQATPVPRSSRTRRRLAGPAPGDDDAEPAQTPTASPSPRTAPAPAQRSRAVSEPSSDDPGADEQSRSLAARSRVQEIKASLYRAMRSETRTPSADSVNLILTPLAPRKPLATGGALRAEPLGPKPSKEGAEGQSAGAERGRRSRPMEPPLSHGGGAAGSDERGREQLDPQQQAGGQAAGGQERRVLKTRVMRRVEAAEQREQRVAQWRAEDGARVLEAAERERLERVQRANEDFARYVEGVAMAVAGDGAGGVGGWRDARQQHQEEREARQQQQQQLEQKHREQQQRQQQLQQQQRQQQREQQREQADMLRGVADMFRSFALKAQSAAAAAAMVAGVSPATAVAVAAGRSEAAQAAQVGEASYGGSGFFGLRRATDVQLILTPVTPAPQPEWRLPEKKVKAGDATGAGAGADVAAQPDATSSSKVGGLHTKPLPTRADLLRLMRPVAKTRLPPFTRSVGLRFYSRNRRPRLLQPSMGAAEAAGVLADGPWASPGEVRALRRRAYYYRHLQRAQAAPGEEGDPEPQDQDQEAGVEQEGAARAAEQPSTPQLRPRYALSGRSFNLRKRFQYTDTVKQAVRKATLARGATAAAAAAAVVAGGGGGGGGGGGDEPVAEVEEDPRGEYNSAAEVTNDAYEQLMGVRLPERAMYGRRAVALAALTPKDVKERTRSWIEACGKDYALAFHAREPLLLAQPAQTLLLSLEHLSRVFSLQPDECVELALRSPALIGLPYEQLQGTVEAVSEALEVGMQEAGKIVMRLPMLVVRQPTFPVSRRVELMGALLPVSKDKLRQVLRQRPLLLSKSLQNLAAFMINASTALGLPLFDVSVMIAGAPGVTGVSSARLASRWEALQRTACRHPQWKDQLATISPPSLGRCLVANEAAMARLQSVLDLGLADEPDFSSFKRVLTMSASRFESLAAKVRQHGHTAAAPLHAAHVTRPAGVHVVGPGTMTAAALGRAAAETELTSSRR